LFDSFALIFDWDGVIVDSSMLHQRSYEILADELNMPLPNNHFCKGFGKRNETIIPEILRWTRDHQKIAAWGKRKEEIYRLLAKEEGIVLQKGARQFLEFAHKASIPCSVGTSTEKANVELACSQFGLEKFFLSITSSEDVSEGKSNPEVFIKACKKLSVSPENAVVFEDSPHGIKAGIAGGMKTIALTTTHNLKAFSDLHPSMIIDSFDDLRMDNVRELFS